MEEKKNISKRIVRQDKKRINELVSRWGEIGIEEIKETLDTVSNFGVAVKSIIEESGKSLSYSDKQNVDAIRELLNKGDLSFEQQVKLLGEIAEIRREQRNFILKIIDKMIELIKIVGGVVIAVCTLSFIFKKNDNDDSNV